MHVGFDIIKDLYIYSTFKYSYSIFNLTTGHHGT